MSELHSNTGSGLLADPDEVVVRAGGGAPPAGTTLAVAIADSVDPAITLVNFTYTVVVTNTGAVDATTVMALVTLDPSLTFVSGSGTGWSVGAVGQLVTCSRALLAPGAAPTITITVTTAGAASTETTTADATAANAPSATQDVETTVVKLVDVDATSGKRLPSSLVQWQDFNAYHVAIGTADFPNVLPSSLWLLQEASGTLADSIGSVPLTQTGAGHLYQQTVAGWARKAVKCVDGTASQRWLNTSTAPNAGTTDVLLIGIVDVPAASPAANRDVLGHAAAADCRFNTTGKLRAGFGAAADLLQDPRGRQMPIAVQVNNTGSASAIYTDQERFTGTYALPANTPMVFLGGQTASASGAGYLYAVDFVGAAARMTAANMKALLQTMNFTIPWT
jgi:uncharacterized repeat protein (TIGR01451 family)